MAPGSSGRRLDAPELDLGTYLRRMDVRRAEGSRIDDLLNYRARAPEAAHNHPAEWHLLPRYVARGAGAGQITHLPQSTAFGILRMDAFAFG